MYQDVKRYLKRKLQQPSKGKEWSDQDNLLFLNYIQSRYTDEEIEKDIPEIHQAFRDFFEPVGNIVVHFNPDTGIGYKILPYYTQPKESKHLQALIDIIRNDRRNIEYPYQGRDDQIALTGKIQNAINAEIIETDEAVNKKELIRVAIKEALELEPHDVIVQLKQKYIIKIFQVNPYLNLVAPDPKPRDESEARFKGYNSDDLENHYNELLNDIDVENFLDNVMALLFGGKLNFQEIDNSYFEKNVRSLTCHTIAQELALYISYNEEYLLGFAGYILRNNFEGIYQRIAMELFELISKKDENAQKFLNYYSGEIDVENAEGYPIPEVTTPDGSQNLDMNRDAFHTMLGSFVKALMQRKKR
ncbi:MAG: hypothetical protein U9Q62_00850 [Campylobacterota bacterium]|nr:hypothetical protein [Campylobacterota bacterium]